VETIPGSAHPRTDPPPNFPLSQILNICEVQFFQLLLDGLPNS
jgi:hypothetical protein